MAIESILINTPDVAESADFYTRFLRAKTLGQVTADQAVLDLETATIELHHIPEPAASTWQPDDLYRGFRHIGFKVDAVGPLAAQLKAAGVPFHLTPLDAEGGVRITFFYAPEGTLLELVEGDLDYHVVHNPAGVTRERALGVPTRPRFDHVALTVERFPDTEAFYGPYGFQRIGTIEQPKDPRGFHIDYLKAGDTVLEVFTYDVDTKPRRPQLDAAGFVAVVLGPPDGGSVEGNTVLGATQDGTTILADPDGLTFAPSRPSAQAVDEQAHGVG